MPKVMANGINIYYELMGKGDPLALIGGSLFGRQNFAMVWEGLAESFQLISYDQRGYGQTDRPLMRYDPRYLGGRPGGAAGRASN